MQNDPNLNLIVETIKEVLKPQKIILFGSRARGDNREDSDYDIAIVQDNPPKFGERANISHLLDEKGLKWPKELDAHIISKSTFNELIAENDFFIEQILKGRTLYEQ